ncbi:MAG: hypothetical protein US22_C0035G0001 [candidate division TM6 bacterium GW2011_GWF2_36_6]|nr:MAG: hypothetical protein US22_C0035G0001 [candidate division TM6 bacterium GW2011_GWF2_36_6]
MLKPSGIMAFVLKADSEGYKCLLIRRCSQYLYGNWQMVSGGIDKGEVAHQTALREIIEETGLVPARFYSANTVEVYYDAERDIIMTNPVFVAFIESEQKVKLSPSEHDAFKWVSIDEALKILEFPQQRENLLNVYENFIKKEPMQFLKINIDDIAFRYDRDLSLNNRFYQKNNTNLNI